MTMGSRRSSDGDTSVDDLDLKNSISLEFDDYPLDLVSPLSRDYDDQDLLPTTNWNMPSGSLDFGDPQDTYLTEDTYKFVDERDRFITDEIITDFGKRKSGEYKMTDGPNGQVFLTVTSPHKANGAYPRVQPTIKEEDEDHYDAKPNCCVRFREWVRSSCRLCLSKYYAVPDSPAWYDKWRYALLCPPHGWLSHLTGLVLLTFIVWGLFWTVDRAGAGFGGGLFALLVLTVCSFIAGRLVECIRFPGLVGMFVVGCLMRNVPALNLARNIDPQLASILRELGMASLLLRSSLALTPRSLRLQAVGVLRLAILPSALETVTIGLTARVILDLPWLWAFLLGFLLSSCGPAVVDPCVLALQARGYGLDKDIPSLLVASSAADTILPAAGFSVILCLLFDKASLVLTIFRGPLEAMGGVLGAIMVGTILWYIPHKQHPSVTLMRSLLLMGCCFLMALGSWALGGNRVMPIGCVTLVFVTVNRWRKEHKLGEKNILEETLKTQWWAFQPLFYGLLGVHTNLAEVEISVIGPGIAVILLGWSVRLISTFVNMFGLSLTHKEKLFVALAWLPKSTVQLSLGPVALVVAREAMAEGPIQDLARAISTVAILTVVMTLTLGGAVTTFTAPYLLSHSSHLINSGDSEKVDLTWDDNMDFNPELSKLRISEISNITTEIEITTERETVT